MGDSKKKKIPTKMKLFITLTVILAISSYANTAAAACVAASWCQACASASSTCAMCYSYAQGTNKNKIWATSGATTCGSTNVTPITDCLYYTSAFMSNSANANAAQTTLSTNFNGVLLCSKCNGKNFVTMTNNTAGNTCTDTAPTMTSGTCAVIANCEQTVCITNAASNSVYCQACSNGAWPATASNGEAITCTTTKPASAVVNCYYNQASITGSTITQGCGGCDSGYALNTTPTINACVLHVASAGCMILQSDLTNCYSCWPSYYFSGALCVLKSFVGVLVGLVAFVTLLIVQ